MVVGLRQAAYEYIRAKLLHGRVSAGSLLSEVEIAKEMGVSRTPVREAMNRLESQGLVRQVPRVGAVVRELSRRELSGLFDLRRLLESDAAARAAKRIGPRAVRRLRAQCDVMRDVSRQIIRSGSATIDGEFACRLATSDAEFHLVVMRAARNPHTLRIVSDFHILAEICGHKVVDPAEDAAALKARLVQAYREHRRIVQALERRDSKSARRWMGLHITRVKRRVMGTFEGRRRGDADWPESLRQQIARMERGTVKGKP